ncbi:MAG: ABC transporter ATP-binding protein [Sutterellaceae bacterium]|nr:ABC transporter ATP-binding protein [Sutterellaceae bacterium]
MTRLTLENLGVTFGEHRVLRDITCELAGGEMVSVIGQNGGGKTTLLKAVAGLLPHSGKVCADLGENQVFQKSIAYVPQLSQVTSRLTVFEMVLLGLVNDLSWRVSKETFDRVDETLHQLNINRLADTPVNRLSGGQKQLVFMAQAFVSRPKILLLDEPTSALDLRHQLVVMNAARDYTDQTGAVTIVVVHDLLTAARFSDKLLLLGDGRIRTFDTPENVLKPETLSDVYKVSVSVEKTDPGFLNVIPLEAL